MPPHCRKPFTGQNDTRPQVATPVFDRPAGNVSTEDLHTYLGHGEATKIFANIMLGFCTDTDSDHCHNNVVTGYNSNDRKTVAAQVEDIKRRHIDGAILTWEGAGTSEDSAALKLQGYVGSKYCSGPQACSPMYLIMYDGPATGYTVTPTGIPGTSGASCSGRSGGDYENCVIAHMRNDLCYLNGFHFGNDAYQKINGRPVLQIFPEDAIIPESGSAPSWTDVWVHLEEWNSDLPKNCAKPPYNANNGVPMIIFENAAGFTRKASSGAYYWLKPEGTDPVRDQSVQNIGPATTSGTLAHFYQTASSHPNTLLWGLAYKGFNSVQSNWGANRIMDQQCGQLWIKSLAESASFNGGSGLPYLQIATWNDYNEGTEIESGIDNCYTVSAKVDGSNLAWSLETANPSAASLTTVSHIEIYDSRNGRDVTLLANIPAAPNGTMALDKLSAGPHTFIVRMVGKNSILNRISAPVQYARH